MKWQKIDELEIESKRPFLNDSDNVFFLREFTARGGFSAGNTNNLISNLQKGVNCSSAESYYRDQAIATFARELRHILKAAEGESYICPMPPRQCREDPNYDDRIEQVIRAAITGLDDFHELILIENNKTREELREQDVRRPNFLKDNLIVQDVDLGNIDDLIIVDDVLTTGCSVRATSEIIKNKYPDLDIWYMVWAKVIWIEE